MKNKSHYLRVLLICAITFISISAMSQNGSVGIGTTIPDTSAMLDISSTTKGVLIPRLTTSEKNAVVMPATGLLIYQTDSIPGFYYYQDNWKLLTLSSAGFADTALSNLSQSTAIGVNLNPASSGIRNLGSLDSAWNNGYFKGSIFLDSAMFLSSNGNNAFAGPSAGNTTLAGTGNTGVGSRSLSALTTGTGNTATGSDALFSNTTGSYNNAHGIESLFSNTTGSNNLAFGRSALYSNTTGINNVSVGVETLMKNTGSDNTAVGNNALFKNTIGGGNTASGALSLYYNTTGISNSATGNAALYFNSSGIRNTAFGQFGLYYNATTSDNTAIGYAAGDNTTNPTRSTFLGATTSAASNLINVTAIGYGATVSASNSIRAGNTSVTSIGGQVGWTTFSDGRFKKNVKGDVPGLAFINTLHPVTYNLDVAGIDNKLKSTQVAAKSNDMRKEPARQPTPEELQARDEKSTIKYTGFIAQEVEAAANKLNYDFSGVDKPKNSNDYYGIRYAEFVVPLVKAVQELSKKTDEINQLRNEVAALKAMVLKLAEGRP